MSLGLGVGLSISLSATHRPPIVAPPVISDIQFVAVTSGSVSGVTLTCNKPAGATVGRILLAHWTTRAVALDAAMVLPADWVKIAFNGVASGPSVKFAYKIIGLSEPSSYDFTIAAGAAQSVSILLYDYVDLTTPLDVAASVNSGSTGTSMTATAITTVTPGAMLIAGFANHTVTSTTITDPGDMDERIAVTAQCRGTVSDYRQAAAGASGSKVATQGVSARWSAILFALRPRYVTVEADATADVASFAYRNASTKMALSIVDNNLTFAGATTQKTAALANLAGNFHHLNLFAESFGNGDNMLNDWDGVSDLVADLPQPDMDSLFAHYDVLEAAIDPDTWGIFGYRIPWQLTGSTTDAGVTTKSVVGDYSSDGRRLLTNKRAQFVEHTARWAQEWLEKSPKNRRFYLGSEAKGFQSVTAVIVGGNTIRANRNQSWDWDDYTGTAGRADMGQFAFYLAYREGIQLACTRAGVSFSTVRIVTPYPVISHQGDAGVGTGSADALKVDTRNDWLGSPVDYSDINGETVYPGYPNIAAIVLTAEHVRLLAANGIDPDEFVMGIDFGTFNEDNVVTPGVSDHDLAYRRVKGMNAWVAKLLTKYGFNPNEVERDYPEVYFKAQDTIAALSESLKDDYMASVNSAGFIACFEDGVEMPCKWSPFGRGDQSTTSGSQSDPQQWYGGMVVRTVTDNNNHAGTAVVGGGEAQALLGVIETLKANFSPGTLLYGVTLSDTRLRALASGSKIFVQNQSPDTITLSVNGGDPVTFTAYQYQTLDYEA